ncbi:MAG: hypothetical protein ACXWWR_03630, partial [Candidatus Limnocylindrales bacterium]
MSTPRRAALGRAIGAMLIVAAAVGLSTGGLLIGRGLASRASEAGPPALPVSTDAPGPTGAGGRPTAASGATAVLVGAGDIAS